MTSNQRLPEWQISYTSGQTTVRSRPFQAKGRYMTPHYNVEKNQFVIEFFNAAYELIETARIDVEPDS